MAPSKKKPACIHQALQFEPSPNADKVSFTRLSPSQLAAAADLSGRASGSRKSDAIVLDDDNDAVEMAACFPAPLVLPGDELSEDPKYDGQDLRAWVELGQRNAVTARRKTLYVASAPVIDDSVSVMAEWTKPQDQSFTARQYPPEPISPDHVLSYLAAFYHGLPVKPFPHQFRFVPWNEKVTPSKFVGLTAGRSTTRIRVRPAPDCTFAKQLHLGDLLDCLIDNLPSDAYAVVLLVDHDLYEDPEDTFCCGRAYGGSRVCIVSSARYRPELDEGSTDIDRQHMWPASHCADYVNKACGIRKTRKRKRLVGARTKVHTTTTSDGAAVVLRKEAPLRAAVEAAKKASACDEDPYELWLSRYVRTAAHELEHCFAIDHCVWYACAMQGTTCLEEDVRQPPYLCPICVRKVARAVLTVNKGVKEDDYLVQRDRALLEVCRKWRGNSMFAGYTAWLETMLERPVGG